MFAQSRDTSLKSFSYIPCLIYWEISMALPSDYIHTAPASPPLHCYWLPWSTWTSGPPHCYTVLNSQTFSLLSALPPVRSSQHQSQSALFTNKSEIKSLLCSKPVNVSLSRSQWKPKSWQWWMRLRSLWPSRRLPSPGPEPSGRISSLTLPLHEYSTQPLCLRASALASPSAWNPAWSSASFSSSFYSNDRPTVKPGVKLKMATALVLRNPISLSVYFPMYVFPWDLTLSDIIHNLLFIYLLYLLFVCLLY